MEFYLIILLLLILVLVGLIFWIVKIIKFYREKRAKEWKINAAILGLLVLFVCWELRIIPLASDLDFRNQTEDLTGKKIWCWNEYRYEEIGIRGEGFTFEIYVLNDKMSKYFTNPDKEFLQSFLSEKFKTSKWRETPILDTELVNYVTPIYGNWSQDLQKEIEDKQRIVKEVAKDKGSYYAVRQSNGTDLYLISPKRKIIIYINHNM